ncbi:hypothetical protein [Virgibacillus ihumii]|uniref:hypothetical protein n=1 Tax=Virgibacillus ihumii TaxID=2686091 RepID=UPI00157CB609|nr:hypothetical protein [Virgibacillus ihumii]
MRKTRASSRTSSYFLPKMLDEPGCFNFTFKYEGMDIVDVKVERREEECWPLGIPDQEQHQWRR